MLCVWTFACIYVSTHVYLVEARRWCRISWNWSYWHLWSCGWIMGIEPVSSGGTASALNQRAISSVPIHIFMKLDDSMFLINVYYYGVDVSDLLVPLVIEDHHGCFYFGQVWIRMKMGFFFLPLFWLLCVCIECTVIMLAISLTYPLLPLVAPFFSIILPPSFMLFLFVCAGLMQKSTASMCFSLWLPCHIQKTAFHSVLLHPQALTVFLLPLMMFSGPGRGDDVCFA